MRLGRWIPKKSKTKLHFIFESVVSTIISDARIFPCDTAPSRSVMFVLWLRPSPAPQKYRNKHCSYNMPMVVRWVLIRLVTCFMATFSLSIPLVADAVHSGPLSEAISMLMPKVVKCVLSAEMSPDDDEEFPGIQGQVVRVHQLKWV